jgi:hypothetical protein
VKQARSFRFALFLALLLNALGSPMAWAQWLEAGTHAHSAPAAEMGTGCHGHDDASPGQPAGPGSMPCCDGGGCVCAAAALVVFVASQTTDARHPVLDVPLEITALPAHPLDDSLRPPIA